MKGKISCKQAVDRISKKEEGKLSAAQRFRLWQHLGECSLCRNFAAQNKIIAAALRQPLPGSLTPAEKEAIAATAIGSQR